MDLLEKSVMLLAQADGAAKAGGGEGSLLSLLAPIVATVALFYFIMWRPESKRRQEHQDLVNALKKNDKIVTVGGLHGTVVGEKDDVVTVRIDDDKDVKIRINRSAVATVVKSKKDKEDEPSK